MQSIECKLAKVKPNGKLLETNHFCLLLVRLECTASEADGGGVASQSGLTMGLHPSHRSHALPKAFKAVPAATLLDTKLAHSALHFSKYLES